MADTKIEWTDKTWNPITGCSKISEGCQNCYAERMAKRFWRDKTVKPGEVTTVIRGFGDVKRHPESLEEPLHWRKPQKIFVCSMGDLFHASVPFMAIAQVFGIMHSCKQHTFMVLTKRPQSMKEFIEWFTGPDWRGAWPNEYPHVWLGVTAENQQRADERIPLLLETPAAVRFVSIEPMLGPVDLTKIPWIEDPIIPGDRRNALHEIWDPAFPIRLTRHKLDWVICGGETGPGARPMHPDWARGLKDQCQESGTPFCFKSWGDWFPYRPSSYGYYMPLEGMGEPTLPKRPMIKSPWEIGGEWLNHRGVVHACRVGKKNAGRLLDGQEWNQYPEVRIHA